MDDPDDCYSWQPWKFGMKREDLYTKLHDQYNTITFAIQDPDAFHLDVYEISKLAANVEDFHRKLEHRKQHRLDQLNSSLQSASVEIIANPQLIGTDQWQHAIQLFRTRSFDSLVRYFSSYLPEDHEWHSAGEDPCSRPFFDEFVDSTPIMTHEPLSFTSAISTNSIPASHFPPSPRSLTICSDSSSASTPDGMISFSELEADAITLANTLNADYDDDTSQWDDLDTPTTPMSEISDINSSEYFPDGKLQKGHLAHEPHTPSAPPPSTEDASESKTPTPADTTADFEMLRESATISALKQMKYPFKYTQLKQKSCRRSPGSSRTTPRLSPGAGRIQKRPADPLHTRLRSLKR